MKTVLFALALPVLALAGGDDASWAAGEAGHSAAPVAPHVSVTEYDSPHSSGDSSWIIHTTVSYSVGPGYTSMIMKPAATSTTSIPAGASGWASPAVASPTAPKTYTGDAAQVVAGAGAIVVAGLAYLL